MRGGFLLYVDDGGIFWCDGGMNLSEMRLVGDRGILGWMGIVGRDWCYFFKNLKEKKRRWLNDGNSKNGGF